MLLRPLQYGGSGLLHRVGQFRLCSSDRIFLKIDMYLSHDYRSKIFFYFVAAVCAGKMQRNFCRDFLHTVLFVCVLLTYVSRSRVISLELE
jgi:hypothetical protein